MLVARIISDLTAACGSDRALHPRVPREREGTGSRRRGCHLMANPLCACVRRCNRGRQGVSSTCQNSRRRLGAGGADAAEGAAWVGSLTGRQRSGRVEPSPRRSASFRREKTRSSACCRRERRNVTAEGLYRNTSFPPTHVSHRHLRMLRCLCSSLPWRISTRHNRTRATRLELLSPRRTADGGHGQRAGAAGPSRAKPGRHRPTPWLRRVAHDCSALGLCIIRPCQRFKITAPYH